MPSDEAVVNHDFTPDCEDALSGPCRCRSVLAAVFIFRSTQFSEKLMAFGFRKRLPAPVAPAVELGPDKPITTTDAPCASETDSAKEILELLELELGAMIRQLERAANSVAGGAEATAMTLSTIRQRTDALNGRTSSAQSTATKFAEAAEKFTHSAEGIGSQVRGASEL